MPAPGEIPAAKPIIAETLFVDGANAELKDVVIEEDKEREYVRGMKASERAKLRANITEWEKAKGMNVSMANVNTLLQALKADIDKPATFTEGLEKGGGGMVDQMLAGAAEIPKYATSEFFKMAEAPTLGGKAIVIGKNVLIWGGALWLAKRIHDYVDDSIENGTKKGGWGRFTSNLLKWTGMTALAAGTLYWLGGEKSAAAAPAVAPIAGGPPELQEMGTGDDLMKLKPKEFIDVDGVQVKIGREWLNKEILPTMVFNVGGKRYALELTDGERTVAGIMSLRTGKDHYIAEAGGKTVRIKKSDMGTIVQSLYGKDTVDVPEITIEKYNESSKRYIQEKRKLSFKLLP